MGLLQVATRSTVKTRSMAQRDEVRVYDMNIMRSLPAHNSHPHRV